MAIKTFLSQVKHAKKNVLNNLYHRYYFLTKKSGQQIVCKVNCREHHK